MHRSEASPTVNQVQRYRPPCPNCGGPTILATIQPTPERDRNELHTFRCLQCGTTEVVEMK
jgi:ribosomal protein S27AE